MRTNKAQRKGTPLPSRLKWLFWDVDFKELTWEKNIDYIIERVLTYGDWKTVQYLRQRVSDNYLRRWMLRREGRGLDPQALRFWELVLGLDHRRVSKWIATAKQNPWYNRLHHDTTRRNPLRKTT